ncbi:hypothetical protein [Pontixanthobacter sp. CEM42]|uniref:hypothetical protein n=1 Tax=Pontixanthobacter sp. CEM42 TaxID=2792077 RepID=UPI001AE038D7|nr:hypothetical protein [Pontixanthobacter sp. CEM42]
MKSILGTLLASFALAGCVVQSDPDTAEVRPPFPQSFAYNCDPDGSAMPTLGAPWLSEKRGYLPLRFEKAQTEDPATTPEVQQCLYYDFMWRSFIALNWPAALPGRRGEPDSGSSIFAIGELNANPTTVWETYKTPQDIFTTPDRWQSPEVANWGDSPLGKGRDFLAFPDALTDYRPDVQQPYFFGSSTGPLIDQNRNYVRYEVAVNEAFFTYVRAFQYYDASKQRDAITRYLLDPTSVGAFQRPPFGNERDFDTYLRDLPAYARQGMVDVKAAWKVLPEGEAENARYLKRRIVIDGEGNTRLYGLVALHILRYTPNNFNAEKGIDGAFVAATFEHVDNVAINFEPPSDSTLAPSFNPGGGPRSHEQKMYGFDGAIPPCPVADKSPGQAPCSSGETDDPSRDPVDVYRVTALTEPIQNINAHYQTNVLGKDFEGSPSVMRFYRLIGTQNKHPGPIDMSDPAKRNLNGHQGPITGVYTNTNNLINSALESYTQKNFSCILCHAKAKPKCTPEKAFEEDHFKILTFLLNSAKFEDGEGCTPGAAN